MADFYVYFQIGLKHVLDWNGYDHVLFLMVLSCTASFKELKKSLLLVSFFTVGHTLSLLLAVFEIIVVKAYVIELLIPITIFATAFFNILSIKKSSKNNDLVAVSCVTFLFGIVHGLGFSNYFKNLLFGSVSDKIVPTLGFAAGIEVAQILVVLVVLIGSSLCQNIFKISKRDFVLVVSAVIIGVVLPLIVQRF